MHEVTPAKIFYGVFAALIVLTAITVAVTYLDLGAFNLVIALAIAFTKATLVLYFFMDLKQGTALTKLFVAAGLFWLAILAVLTFGDYMTRQWPDVPLPWEKL
jgi:cytochrome c oxidase subunit 4